MSIRNDVQELHKFDQEIKRMNKEIQQLRKLKKDCENRILDYCITNKQPGVSYNQITVYVDKKPKIVPNKKTDKLSKGEVILQKHGISNSKEIIQELLNAMKGESEEKASLKIINK